MTTYFLVSTEYVGPNSHDSQGTPIGDSKRYYIQTEPGCQNMSGESLDDGWLGTTNDLSEYGCGRFDSLDKARLAVRRSLGNDCVQVKDDDDRLEPPVIECWQSAAAARLQVDADDYLDVGNIDDVTAATTNDELNQIAEQIEIAERNEADIELHGALDFITRMRDEMIEAMEG